MGNFFEHKGKLTVSLGNGYLSAYEVNNLKVGDVVRIDRTAGEDYYAYFNDSFLCFGELMIMDDIFGLFPKINSNGNQKQEGFKGMVDDVVEILPTEIRFAQIDISLRELFGVNEGPIISLGKRYGKSGMAELLVAGTPVAKGDVVIIGESFGIEITETYYHDREEIEVRSSEYLVDKDTLSYPVKKYDFKRPDKFSKDQMISILKIHNLFLKNLKLIAPSMKGLQVITIDQLTYKEALGYVNPDYSVVIVGDVVRGKPFALTDKKQSYIIDDSDPPVREYSKNRLIIETEGLDSYLPAETYEKLKKFKRGRGNPLGNIIIFYNQKYSLSKAFKTDDSIHEFVLSPLRSSWKTITNTRLKILEKNENINSVNPVHPMEMCLLVEIGGDKIPEDKLYIVYPYIYLAPILKLLS
jgi:flagellar motor switch protein FliM